MRRAVMGSLFVAAAYVAVLFPFIRLIPLLVHDAAAVGTNLTLPDGAQSRRLLVGPDVGRGRGSTSVSKK